ncbi:hypothetical protein FRC03_004702 [Tulasnella sp. 419]|nr:hypothetical protein FRC03_004702 [Tulasnella sp. 419]
MNDGLEDATPISEAELDSLLKDLFRPSPRKEPQSKLDDISRRKHSISPTHHDGLESLKERLNLRLDGHVIQEETGGKQQPTLADKLLARLAPVNEPALSNVAEKHHATQHHDFLKVYARLEAAIQKAEQSLASSSTAPTVTVPLGVATLHEWTSLFNQALIARDRGTAESVLQLMKRSGVTVPAEQYDSLMAAYVSARDADGAAEYLERQRQAGILPTKTQQHLHVQAFLQAHRIQEARSIVFRYEEENRPPAQETYLLLVKTLLSSRSAMAGQHRATAWDTFAHMRYVAHPNPSAEMYSTMISACADASVPQPHRALDLFTEMTVDHKIPPTRDAYNAVIRACARSRDKAFAYEAFRLAKELVETHNSIEADTVEEQSIKDSLRPNIDTFSALLEVTMRTGDLARARWILAEMIQAGERLNDTIMGHVFHTYATYNPSMKKSLVKELGKTQEVSVEPEHEPIEASSQPTEVTTSSENNSNLMPQTRAGILREVKALFCRIISGHGSEGSAPGFNPDLAFSGVQITTNLLNSLLAVHYRHSTTSAAIRIYNEVFPQFNVARNSQSYADALAALVISKSGKESAKVKIKARELAEPIWESWVEWRASLRSNPSDYTLGDAAISPRRIEKMYSDMIRIRIGAGDCPGAVDLVKDFVKHYPPDALSRVEIAQASSDPSRKSSSRIALEAKQRLLVRLTTDLEITDVAIPPFLTFSDISPIHQMLLRSQESNRKKHLSYLTWVSNAYAGHLKQRKLLATLGKNVRG